MTSKFNLNKGIMNSQKERIKIYIITINEPFYVNPVIREVINCLHEDITGISIVPETTKQSFFKRYFRIFRMFGFFGFCNLTIRMAYLKTREFLGIDSSFKKLIKKHDIYQIKTRDVNNHDFISKLKKLKVDLIISFCGQIYKKEILSVPKIGVINKHCSLLPKYKGIYPIFWAMLNNDNETGVTLHFMDEQIDKGQIIAQEKIPIKKEDSFNSLYIKCHKVVPNLIFKTIENIKKRKKYKQIKRGGVDRKEARVFGYPKKEDIAQFKLLNKKFF